MLFAIASYGDRRADQGRSLIRSPYVYTLSLGVYCTAWTFYGSVGLASRQGLDFLPVYLGPTLAALLFGFLVRRCCGSPRRRASPRSPTSSPPATARAPSWPAWSRSSAMLGAIPYIALQLKAVAASVTALIGGPAEASGGADTALWSCC